MRGGYKLQTYQRSPLLLSSDYVDGDRDYSRNVSNFNQISQLIAAKCFIDDLKTEFRRNKTQLVPHRKQIASRYRDQRRDAAWVKKLFILRNISNTQTL